MTSNPVDQILSAFQSSHVAFMPYFTLGYPTYDSSLEIIKACTDGGADIMELGIPFSDPIADGKIIQHSTHHALENGITPRQCLEGINKIRGMGVKTPFMVMSYFNPILSWGIGRFIKDAHDAGVNGFIIPDLPIEESLSIEVECEKYNMGLSYMLAPNSQSDRTEKILEHSKGFIYLASVLGITGERSTLPLHLDKFILNTKKRTVKPLAVGFGISTPDQARIVGSLADGVIIGSALVRTITNVLYDKKDLGLVASSFVKSYVDALKTTKYNIL